MAILRDLEEMEDMVMSTGKTDGRDGDVKR